jgi:hypothetical protein
LKPENPRELRKPTRDARRLLGARLDDPEIDGQFPIECLPGVLHHRTPMQPFHSLFGSKRDQNAYNDDPDLASELTPAVKRFRKMEVHAALPGGNVTVTEGPSGRNGSRAAGRLRVETRLSTLVLSDERSDSEIEEADDWTVERSCVSASVEDHRILVGIDLTTELLDVFGPDGPPVGIGEAAIVGNCE